MRFRILPGAILLASAAACGTPPTILTEGPSFDGGWTIGTNQHSDTTAAQPAQSCGAGTGGWTIGSGKATEPQDPCADL